MKSDTLPRFEPPSCSSCRTFAPECMLPVGDGAVPVCWLCAHLVTVHEHALGAPVTNCGCTAAEIYPAHVQARRSPPELAEGTALTLIENGPSGAPRMVQTFEIVEPVFDREHSTRVSQGMRAARIARSLRPVTK